MDGLQWKILKTHLVGGFNPSETYQSGGITIPNAWKNKNVPNHQPDMDDLGLPPVERNETTNFICQVALMEPPNLGPGREKMKP